MGLRRTVILLSICLLLSFAGNKLSGQDIKFIHYTNSDGLPYSAITDFVQDSQGFMWVGMRNSLCRFDGYEFKEYFPIDSAGIRVPLRIPKLLTDGYGSLFLTTSDFRFFKYDEKLDIFNELILPSELRRYSLFRESQSGAFWVLAKEKIFHYVPEDQFCTPIEEIYSFVAPELKGEHVLRIVEADEFIYVLLAAGKIVRINSEFKISEKFTYSNTGNELVPAGLFDADDSGNIWIGDDQEGLYRVSFSDNEVELFSSDSPGNNRILHNMVRSITCDGLNRLWIGTENGLNIWDPADGTMKSYRYDFSNPDGLNSNAIYKLFTDNRGNVWVGTYFGGINIWYSGKEFFSVIEHGLTDYNLSGKQVSCITEDPAGNIWVGLEGNGYNIIDYETGIITKYENDSLRISLSYNNVHALLNARDSKAYIGTYTGGLNIFNPSDNTFRVLTKSNSDVSIPGIIYALLQTGDSILIGTEDGVFVYNTYTRLVSKFFHEDFSGKIIESFCRVNDEVWISARNSAFVWNIKNNSLERINLYEPEASISFIASDSQQNLWFGDSYSGLHRYNRDAGNFDNYNYSNGFPADRVFGLIEGEDGWYWVSTTKGLLKFRPATNSIITFNTKSGLPFNQFNFNAYYKSTRGQIYFGGISGLIYFEDSEENISNPVEDIVFTGLSVFNKRVIPGENSILEEDLRFSGKIKLKYSEKIFSVSYSALNFTHPGRVQYSYMLEGLSDEWISAGNQNSLTFTSLPPGNYQLRVRSSFDNSTLSSSEASLTIVVKPPFYLSVLAFVVYALLFLISLLIFYLVSRQIEKSKALALIERSEKMQEKRMNQSKLEFFTNVSHELKTPLTLIIGRLTGLVRQGSLSNKHKESLISINDNARRLLALINQLMEFRKSDLGKSTLKVSEGDINLFAREIKESFDYVAEMRNIDFRIIITTPFKAIWFDHEKIERILFNLLSNAFKYTKDGGTIIISVKSEKSADNGSENLRIDIEDNGSGIDPKDLDRIFDRFYRTEAESKTNQGSGIGLALVRNLVKLHKGKIDVRSKLGKGTVFSLVLPCSRLAYSSEELYCEELSYTMNTEELIHLEHNREYQSDDPVLEPERETILIVDDNTELLSFLCESISGKFNVITALNGNEAIERIAKNRPDVIICDIMMPGMDGYELTTRVKSSIETSHIPVILLSARTEVDDKYRGLLAGADSYIEKPFYPHLLLKHIENILNTRKKLISTFRENLKSKPSDIAQTKSDKEFIDKLSAIINANIDNPELDVTFLVNEMSVSRSLLHLKLKKIAGCSATSFIRTLRLRSAASLIIEEGISFSEAAYRTGFSSPAFFSRRFKEYFDKTPSEFLDDYKSGV